MKRLFLVIISLLLAVIVSASHIEITKAAESRSRLTLMVYMCGSNLESIAASASMDLQEMAASGYNFQDVNVLVMTGGTRKWMLDLPTDSLCVYMPGRGSMRMLEAFDLASMGSPDPLATLLDYGYHQYPAENYALIFWDHGGGPLNGLCIDELFESDDLSMEELYSALAASPFVNEKLSWIGFDACLMGSAEVAAILSPFAEYMIASEETEPGTGWNYSFLNGIENDESGAETGHRIIDSYFEFSEDQTRLTLSLVDLSVIDDLIHSSDAFFQTIGITGGNYSLISYAAGNTRSFGRSATDAFCYDLIDLGKLIDSLCIGGAENSTQILEDLNRAVLYNRSSEDAEGLSVYHPFRNKPSYSEHWGAQYPSLGLSPGYTDYINRFAGYLFGDTDVSWAGIRAVRTDTEGIYALPLSDSQCNMIASASMNILNWDEEQSAYASVCSVSDLTLQDQVLYGAYPGQYLAAVSVDGSVLTEGIPYQLMDDGCFQIYVNYCKKDAADSPEALRLVSSTGLPGREDTNFGSYSFDVQDSSTSSLEGSVSTGTVTKDSVSPLSSSDLSEALVVPSSVSLGLSTSPVTSSSTDSWLQLTEQDGIVPIMPVTTTSLFEEPQYSYTISQAGSSVPVTLLTPIGISAFELSQVEIDLTGHFEPVSAENTPDVLHAMLDCKVLDDGKISITQSWYYDEDLDLWSTRYSADPEEYPFVLIPLSFREPVAIAEDQASSDLELPALSGFEFWEEKYTDAYVLDNQDWHLQFVPCADDPASALCISFEITDIQNQKYSSIPLLY